MGSEMCIRDSWSFQGDMDPAIAQLNIFQATVLSLCPPNILRAMRPASPIMLGAVTPRQTAVVLPPSGLRSPSTLALSYDVATAALPFNPTGVNSGGTFTAAVLYDTNQSLRKDRNRCDIYSLFEGRLSSCLLKSIS